MTKRVGLILRLFLLGILFMSVFSSCKNKGLEPEIVDNPIDLTRKLNQNVQGLRNLARVCTVSDSIAIFSIKYNSDESVIFQIGMKNESDVELFSEIVTHNLSAPEVSFDRHGDDFYWIINGSFLTDLNGERIRVLDDASPIVFFLKGDSIFCKVEDSLIGEYPTTKAGYLSRDVSLDYDVDNNSFIICLSSGFECELPTIKGFRLLKDNVPNQSYYKDVFLDAGIGLSSRKSLAAASYLKLSLEGISFSRSDATSEEYKLQNDILAGNAEDLNGRLLYPDGQPRYRLLFVNGGSSTTHGRSLTERSLNNMRLFVLNGGSYVGTCAGAFFASKGYDKESDYPYYLSLWPGVMKHTGLSNVYSGMFLEENSPLLTYADFGNDYYVDSVRHNAGGYPADLPIGTEVIARYDYPDKTDVHNRPSIWAYKSNPLTGRIVQTGSHPEEVWSGERLELTAAMVQYALDGNGPVTVKGYLKNGEVRVMDKKTSDEDPDYTRIGDLQTHHFASYIPSNAKNIRVEINSDSDCNLALMMSQDSYAFLDSAEYISMDPGARQSLFFPYIREGVWYIAVKCLTTVEVYDTEYGQSYSGKLNVLNGIPYRVKITWEK